MKKILAVIALSALAIASVPSDMKSTKIIKTIERVDDNGTKKQTKTIINIHLKNSNKCKIVIN